MKTTLIFTAVIVVLAVFGALFVYYLSLIPQQDSELEEDIKAIREVIAPEKTKQKNPQSEPEFYDTSTH